MDEISAQIHRARKPILSNSNVDTAEIALVNLRSVWKEMKNPTCDTFSAPASEAEGSIGSGLFNGEVRTYSLYLRRGACDFDALLAPLDSSQRRSFDGWSLYFGSGLSLLSTQIKEAESTWRKKRAQLKRRESSCAQRQNLHNHTPVKIEQKGPRRSREQCCARQCTICNATPPERRSCASTVPLLRR